MKSQPEIQIRRLAVFGGFSSSDPGPSWHRVPSEPATEAQSTETDDEPIVIQLAPGAFDRDLQHAA